MSGARGTDTAVLPPLLRPQAFDHPGAAEWVATQPTIRQLDGRWLVAGCVLGLILAVTVLINVTYRQGYQYPGSLLRDTLACQASGCEVSLILQVTGPRPGEMGDGTNLLLAADGRVPVTSRVLARQPNGSGRTGAWRVSWPRSAPLPTGSVRVAGAQERTLLGWMLPHRRNTVDPKRAP